MTALNLPEGATWATVAAFVVSIVAWLIVRGATSAEKRRERLEEAEKALSDAWASGDVERIAKATRRYEAAKKALLLGFALLALSGCRSAPEPIVIGTYHLTPEPGATVPELPTGEVRWHLISYPTGVRNAFPSDSPLLLP